VRPPTKPLKGLELEIATLEARLAGQPHEVLGIPEDASNSEACAAYVERAAEFHPRRFANAEPRIVRRSVIAYRRLRAALNAFTAREERAVTQRFTPIRPRDS